MFYTKNLPSWERALRLVAGLGMGLCAWQFWGTPLGYVFALGGAVMAATSTVGFCPMCALAGRRLDRRNGNGT